MSAEGIGEIDQEKKGGATVWVRMLQGYLYIRLHIDTHVCRSVLVCLFVYQYVLYFCAINHMCLHGLTIMITLDMCGYQPSRVNNCITDALLLSAINSS